MIFHSMINRRNLLPLPICGPICGPTLKSILVNKDLNPIMTTKGEY